MMVTMDTVEQRLKQLCASFQLTMEAAEADDFSSDPENEQNIENGFSPVVLNDMFAKRCRNVYIPARNAICAGLNGLYEQVVEAGKKNTEVLE